jgi:hypothetical protein
MIEIAETFADSSHALRSVHAKSHGLLKDSFEVLTGLPDALAQGLFAKPATYPVAMTFSTIPGDLLDESILTPSGWPSKTSASREGVSKGRSETPTRIS